MEELQDAIEDAQYVNAIATQEEGPRPVLSWEIPTEEQLALWQTKVRQSTQTSDVTPFTPDWYLSSAIGFFLFSAYLKEECHDYPRINFIEEVIRWNKLRGKHRVDRANKIIEVYLKKLPLDENTGQQVFPQHTEIDEYDLRRPPPETRSKMSDADFKALYAKSWDPTKSCNCLGLQGPAVNELIFSLQDLETTLSKKSAANTRKSTPVIPSNMRAMHSQEEALDGKDDSSTVSNTSAPPTSNDIARRQLEKYASLRELTKINKDQIDDTLPNSIFDKVDSLVVESLRQEYWAGFLESEQYKRLLNFLWFRDRRIVPDDFFTMRVLGRGGFGSVIACKKGTSGKLYAMKVMDKKRIKLKKSEQLILNERKALSSVESPFVVNLKYSFHSKEDIFLILDLMTGGDLGYHLHQKGRFPKKECQYYAARIMLGLQALHDQGYVYRDLKPENCLLAEDGRVKITDLGLATKITPTLSGAAGTRGYWAPEMLRRDKRGKRKTYGHTVDWFSFGCCLAEFISGANPFRSEAAWNFGLAAGKDTKEKAIDHATLEMDPEFPEILFERDAADLCRRLLEKNEQVRLGTMGCEEIMAHPWFKNMNWESIVADKKRPPYVPPKDVNAASQSEIGQFTEDKKYQECVITEKDEKVYKDWDWTNPHAYAAEVIEFLIYERETGEPLLPMSQNTGCCCTVM
eukprot:Nitzschia sp. Nitz4//scaffold185_size43419//31493//33748//NITZ4_007306-RA/size43419-augustus-gene-0.66-mRNA-1//1//CDS//3329539724//8007//frame0